MTQKCIISAAVHVAQVSCSRTFVLLLFKSFCWGSFKFLRRTTEGQMKSSLFRPWISWITAWTQKKQLCELVSRYESRYLDLYSASSVLWLCLSSPDDCWVKLTGVQVDEAKGDGDGKLPCHAQNDGQHLDVLWRRGKTLRSRNNSYIPAPPPLPCFIVLSRTCSVVINVSGGQNLWICVTRVWCGEVSVPLTFSLCAFLLRRCLFFQSHCWLPTCTSPCKPCTCSLFWEPFWRGRPWLWLVGFRWRKWGQGLLNSLSKDKLQDCNSVFTRCHVEMLGDFNVGE